MRTGLLTFGLVVVVLLAVSPLVRRAGLARSAPGNAAPIAIAEGSSDSPAQTSPSTGNAVGRDPAGVGTSGAAGRDERPTPDGTKGAGAATTSSFGWVDVFIDTGDRPLAAYQFEFTGGPGVQLVGIEGGDAAAFRDPPRYDPRALALAPPRAIVAAFHTGRDLPGGKVRVARLMVRTGPGRPDYRATLQVAAAADPTPIAGATLTMVAGALP